MGFTKDIVKIFAKESKPATSEIVSGTDGHPVDIIKKKRRTLVNLAEKTSDIGDGSSSQKTLLGV